MTRAPVCTAIAALFVFAVSISGQTISSGTGSSGAPSPGVGGAQRPGAPARDNAQPQQRTGTARLRGRVVAAESGAPLRRAQVNVVSPAAGQRSTTTDAEGNYEITGLPAGSYIVNASKNGYIAMQYGQRRPMEPGTPIVLTDGQVKTRVDLRLRRGGVIVVRVMDEFGEPMVGAQVQVQRYQYGPNGRQLMGVGMGPGNFVTDDLGQSRLFGLTPGDYVVGAALRNFNMGGMPGSEDRSEGYTSTYYPGTANPVEAQSVRVDGTQEASAEFALIPARLARISGRVIDSQGRPAGGAQLMLGAATGGGVSMVGGGQVQPDGTFALVRVPPGDHFIRVNPRPVMMDVARGVPGGVNPAGGGDEPEFAYVPITVTGDDITGLTIATTPAGSISGRVVFEGRSPRPPASQMRVFAQMMEAGQFMGVPNPRDSGQVGEDGSFTLRGISGKALFRIGANQWMLKSVTLNGIDITDEPYDLAAAGDIDGLRIVLTDHTSEVSGTVSDDRGQVPDGYVVVVLPAGAREGQAAQRFQRILRLPRADRFSMRGLPPGDYVAAAFESLEQGSEWNPEVREKIRDNGDRFSLTEGQNLTLSLRLRDEP